MTVEPDLRERVRQTLRLLPTGVGVVTTQVDGRPLGLAVNAFSSVSLEPPLVLVCVNRSAETHEHLYAGQHFGVNFLASDQAEIAATFARSGGNKFAALSWLTGAACGVPIIDGVSAFLEAQVQRRLAAGTHTIFLGQVLEAQAYAKPPLLYQGGDFFDGGKLTVPPG